MNRISIFQDETGTRKILRRCMRHRVLYVIAKMTSARTSVKFIAGMGNGPRREEKISATAQVHKSAKRVNLMERPERYQSCYIRRVHQKSRAPLLQFYYTFSETISSEASSTETVFATYKFVKFVFVNLFFFLFS